MPSFEFVRKWFIEAADEAKRQGRRDAALLWKDGLTQLDSMHRKLTRITARAEKLERVAGAAKVLNCYGQYSTDKAWSNLLQALKELEPSDET